MSKNTGQNKKGKKTVGSMIITFIATIIVIVASLLGFGGEDAENANGNASNSGANSEVVAEVEDDISEEGQLQVDTDVIEDEQEREDVVASEDEEDTDVPEEAVSDENDASQDEEYVEEISEEVSEEPVVEEVTVAEITFRSQKLLDQHYEKHGIEMGFTSAEEYELAAYKVVIHPDTLHKIETEDGDDVYYREETNEFVVVSPDGYIRTYFNPSAGIDYYNRQ